MTSTSSSQSLSSSSSLSSPVKQPIEDADSWNAHIERRRSAVSEPREEVADADAGADSANNDYHGRFLRRLHHQDHSNDDTVQSKAGKHEKHRHHDHDDDFDDYDDDFDPVALERVKTAQDLKLEREHEESAARKIAKDAKKRKKRFAELYRNPGIQKQSVHGLMIDAGSTGSRMHVYEFPPRVLADKSQVSSAVSGKKLSFPGTESRWTERLRPGISEFAGIDDDDELRAALAAYLKPLIDFAESVLHEKRAEFDTFPIFLKATAGLRIVPRERRQRIIAAVRELFADDAYCPFWDEEERVRVISGEEEAVYDWAGVNFLLGNLISDSEGSGEAHGADTYGALDMGGASTQISYYEPDGDVMSGLFKLQIGQGKHWNVYAHSHLMFGMNMAEARREARLAANTTVRDRLMDGIYDPCLPGGGRLEIKSNIHFDRNGIETWNASVDDFIASGAAAEAGTYHAVLVNKNDTGDWTQCKALARDILHESSNAWCDFSHRGSCSFAGVYQPRLPNQEFFAFSNYYHVWQFLQLAPRSSIQQLDDRANEVCSQSWEQLKEYNHANPMEQYDDAELSTYCFHAAYVHEILRHGYGFQPEDHITATNVVNGQKVTWALGSILYEINTLPWDYIQTHSQKHMDTKFEREFFQDWDRDFSWFMLVVVVGSIATLLQVFRLHRKREQAKRRQWKEGYQPVSEAEDIEIEKLDHLHQ
ncbi:hypothetical protein ACHAXS_014134 [Conticribra weissflogii]